jgi:succinate dehydrogenase/fumarate reductase flavoprotein subunit
MPTGWDREVDVLAIGAGMGGMRAALVAALHGFEVLLCEKTGQVGGTTATSAGTVWIPGAREADDPAAAAQYLDVADFALHCRTSEIPARRLARRRAGFRPMQPL